MKEGPSEDPNRREVAAGLFGLGWTALGTDALVSRRGQETRHKTEHPESREAFALERVCKFGLLEGRVIGGLGASYLGLDAKERKKPLPGSLRVRFDLSLKDAWDARNKRYPGTAFARKGARMVEQYQKILREGREGATNLQDFTKECREAIRETFTALDWEKVGRTYRLSEDELSAVRGLAGRIDEFTLIPSAITETMSSGRTPADTVLLTDSLLGSAGPAFFDRLPGGGGASEDVGLYQISGPAYAHMLKMFNPALSETRRLPEAIDLLDDPTGVDPVSAKGHHRAAYLLAVEHLCETAKHTGREKDGGELLSSYRELDTEEVADFIAASHHRPAAARSALMACLSAAPHLTPGAFLSACKAETPELHSYILGTQGIRTAFKEYIGRSRLGRLVSELTKLGE